MRGKQKNIKKYADKAKQYVMNEVIMKTLISRGRKAMRELDENSRNAVAISEKLLMKLLDENKMIMNHISDVCWKKMNRGLLALRSRSIMH